MALTIYSALETCKKNMLEEEDVNIRKCFYHQAKGVLLAMLYSSTIDSDSFDSEHRKLEDLFNQQNRNSQEEV